MIPSVLAALPLVMVILLVGLGSARIFSLPYVVASWQRYQERVRKAPGEADVEEGLGKLCLQMTKGGIVATPDPWLIHMVCGNAASTLPRDLATPGVLNRFLDERQPTYFVTGSKAFAYTLLKRSPRLIEIARVTGAVPDDQLVLFEAPEASLPRRSWSLPRPLVCAGRGPECTSVTRAGFFPAGPVKPYDTIVPDLMKRLVPRHTALTRAPAKVDNP
jgi:hypothetical protein